MRLRRALGSSGSKHAYVFHCKVGCIGRSTGFVKVSPQKPVLDLYEPINFHCAPVYASLAAIDDVLEYRKTEHSSFSSSF